MISGWLLLPLAADLQPDAEAGEGAEQRAFSRGMLPYVFGEKCSSSGMGVVLLLQELCASTDSLRTLLPF